MGTYSSETYFANILFGLLWVAVVFLFLVVLRNKEKVKSFRSTMIGMWKYALAVAVISYVCSVLGSINSFSIVLPVAQVFLFCECMVGFAVAKSVLGYEPLPVVRAFAEHKQQWRRLFFLLLYGLLATIAVFIAGQFIPHFGEVNNTAQAVSMLPENKWLLFFTFLSGAGLMEETVYRLIFLSLFWKFIHNKWVAILLSSLLFGAYHLTPLCMPYQVYWQFPIYQFVSATVSGIVFGYLYVKEGYETAVVGHTVSDWLPILLFMK